MIFATKCMLDKTKKSTDNDIRKIALEMDSIEKFNGINDEYLEGKSEEECEQIIAVINLFDQYNEDQTGFLDINDAYKFMKETYNIEIVNGGELACFHLFQKWDLD